MAGTRLWQVNMAFFVEASNDDEALSKVTSTLRYGESDIAWIWQSSKGLTNKGEASVTNN
jgi:hypothetical protein